MLRRALNLLAPHGSVLYYRRFQELRRLGHDVSFWNFSGVRDTYRSCVNAGLSLLPDGELRRIRRIVDVGAFRGKWTRDVLQCAPVQKAVVLEPNPDLYERLEASLLLRQERVALHRVVAGDTNGETTLNRTGDEAMSSVLSPNEAFAETHGSPTNVTDTVPCKVRRLDDLLDPRRPVSLMKVDVQGFELAVLRGARKTLRATKYLLIEMNYYNKYEGGSDFTDVHRALQENHGFVFCNSKPPYIANSGRASYYDALYVNPDCSLPSA